MNLQSVKSLLARQQEQAEQLLANVEAEGRDLTGDETAQLDRLLDDVSKTKALVAKASQLETQERQQLAAAPAPRVAIGGPGGIGATYRQLFNAASPASPHKTFDGFLNAVHARDPRLVTNTMTEGSGTAGGYLVPVEYAGELLDLIYGASVVLPRAYVVPMQSNVKHLVSFDFSDASALAPGGLPMEWLTEGSQATRRTGATKRVILTAIKGAIFADASSELAADGSLGGSFENQLTEALTRSAAYSLDYYFMFGSGSNQPLGIVNDSNPELIKIARAGAGAIGYADLLNMVCRLHPSCYGRAVWIAHPEALTQLLYIERFVSATSPASAIAGDILNVGNQPRGMSMLGFPVVVSEIAASQLGVQGDLSLIDFAGYGIGLRKEMGIESTNASQWLNDKVDWRLILRLDGKPRWSLFTPYSANSPPDAATLSWAVTLDVPAQQ